jgi:hypothetical protein
MNKRQLFFILLLLALTSVSTYAQKWKLRRYEASVSICTSQYYGDIGGSADKNNLFGLKDIQILHTRPSFALGGRYKVSENMAVKMNLIFGIITGNDENSRNNDRNFSFTSTIFEPSLQFEYYIISESKSISSSASFSHRGMINNFGKIYPYVFGGVGGVFFNPKLYKNDVLYIQDNISKFGIAFPLGIGLKLGLSSKLSCGFEFGRRFTTTDYIDGYASKFSKSNDLYDFGMFSIIYKIPTDRRGYPIIGKASKFRL